MSQSFKEILEIKIEKKNPKYFKCSLLNLICTLLISSPCELSIKWHSFIYQDSLLWHALTFSMFYGLRLYPEPLTICFTKMHPGHHGNLMQGNKWISRKASPQTGKKHPKPVSWWMVGQVPYFLIQGQHDCTMRVKWTLKMTSRPQRMTIHKTPKSWVLNITEK